MKPGESFPDYYGTLGVPRYTDTEGVRRAYIRKAWVNHPDLYPESSDAVSEMSSINAAYATLSDPVRRAEYDAQRHMIHIQVPKDPLITHHSPVVTRHRNKWKSEPGILDTTLSLFARLIRYVAA